MEGRGIAAQPGLVAPGRWAVDTTTPQTVRALTGGNLWMGPVFAPAFR